MVDLRDTGRARLSVAHTPSGERCLKLAVQKLVPHLCDKFHFERFERIPRGCHCMPSTRRKVSSWNLWKGRRPRTARERGRGRTDVDNEAASFVGGTCRFRTKSAGPSPCCACAAYAPSGPAKDPTKWSSESPTCSIVTVFCTSRPGCQGISGLPVLRRPYSRPSGIPGTRERVACFVRGWSPCPSDAGEGGVSSTHEQRREERSRGLSSK